jgi:hypothetical protein
MEGLHLFIPIKFRTREACVFDFRSSNNLALCEIRSEHLQKHCQTKLMTSKRAGDLPITYRKGKGFG